MTLKKMQFSGHHHIHLARCFGQEFCKKSEYVVQKKTKNRESLFTNDQ